MINVNKIKARMVELGYTQERLANEMGVDTSTINRKINYSDGSKLTVLEAYKLTEILSIENPTDYFFYKQACVNAS